MDASVARQSAHLLKENLEASESRPLQTSKLRFGDNTPKRALATPSNSSSGKKGLREKRRALGDISNQQRIRLSVGGNGDDSAAHTKKKKKKHKSLKSGGERHGQVVRVKKALDAQAEPAQAAKTQEVEEVEHAYGGLLSPTPDASYLASLREEMRSDILNSKTRSLIDDMEPADALGAWDDEDERALLASGAAPSSWWSQATAEFADDASSDPLWTDGDVPTEDEVPPPDDLPVPSLHDDPANDDLLDELLSVDVDAACQ